MCVCLRKEKCIRLHNAHGVGSTHKRKKQNHTHASKKGGGGEGSQRFRMSAQSCVPVGFSVLWLGSSSALFNGSRN